MATISPWFSQFTDRTVLKAIPFYLRTPKKGNPQFTTCARVLSALTIPWRAASPRVYSDGGGRPCGA